jgi:hypothetical protein
MIHAVNFEPRLDPVDPDPRMIVYCEGCGKDIHIDDAKMLGTELDPHFLCYGETSCAYEFIERLIIILEEQRRMDRR